MGFGLWVEGGKPSCYVASKDRYTKEEFEKECAAEADGYLEVGETKEGYVRWYPTAPEGIDIDGGCYSFCSPGRGAFQVWYADVKTII